MEENKNYPYKIKIKIDENEFEFQSPDKETFETTGINLLKQTFGRYQEQSEE